MRDSRPLQTAVTGKPRARMFLRAIFWLIGLDEVRVAKWLAVGWVCLLVFDHQDVDFESLFW